MGSGCLAYFKRVISPKYAHKLSFLFINLMQFLQIAKYDNNATTIITMAEYQRTLFFWLYGFINAVFIGMIFGIIIAFIFSYILTDRFLFYKGAALGILIFYLNFGVLSIFFNYPPDIKTLPGDMVSMLLSLIIYAVVTTYMLRRLQFFVQG